MIALSVSQKDIAALLESELELVTRSLTILAGTARKYSSDLGDDAAHFLKDIAEQASAAACTLSETAECATDHRDGKVHLATWLHPESTERYCADCADRWAPCGVCSHLMPIADMVSRGETSGHEGCLWIDP